MFDIDLVPLRLSLQVAGLSTAICLAVGLPLAWLLARRRFRGRELVAALTTLPLVLPPTVVGYYVLVTLGRQTALGRFLQDELGIRLTFTWPGAAIAASVVALPLLVRAAQAGFESVDPQLEKVAFTLGRSRLRVFLTVTLPLAGPGVMAGVALAFARAMGEFGATIMVAGNIPGKTQTAPVAIYDATQAGNDALANGLTLVTTLAAVAILTLASLLTARRLNPR